MLQPTEALKLQCLQRQGRDRAGNKHARIQDPGAQFKLCDLGWACNLTASRLAQMLPTSQMPHIEAA